MKNILVGIALLAACGAAEADEDIGFYFGAGAGQVNVDVPGELHFDNSANAWKAFAGWQFTPNFALEGAFIDADSIDHNFGSGLRGTIDGEILQLSAVGTVWLNDTVSLFGRASANDWDSQVSLSTDFARVTDDQGGTDFGFGAGIGAIWDRALFRLEYEQGELGDADTRIVSASIAWRL